MNRSLIISSVLHGALIVITAMSLPFLAKKPLDIPPIVSVELTDKTNLVYTLRSNAKNKPLVISCVYSLTKNATVCFKP